MGPSRLQPARPIEATSSMSKTSTRLRTACSVSDRTLPMGRSVAFGSRRRPNHDCLSAVGGPSLIDHPDIPLHTNGSERDIRSQVTKRKISGGMRSDVGRACRDTFLGLAKTSAKLALHSGIISAAASALPGNPTFRPSQTLSGAAANPIAVATHGNAPLT